MAHATRDKTYRAFPAALALAALVAAGAAHATTFTVLHNFTGPEGMRPQTALLRDGQGNLFGTAEQSSPKKSTGMVFKFTPKGRLIVVHAFRGHEDGNQPEASTVVADTAGNLYGTTQTGGKPIDAKGGTVFKIAPDGTESLLHIFHGVPDGVNPSAGLTIDTAGNLYGTTPGGGTITQCVNTDSSGCGTVFKIAPGGAETVLHAFEGPDGIGLYGADLLVDGSGDIYGVTYAGGAFNTCYGGPGCGTVFKIASDGTFSTLYSFKGINSGGNDGNFPLSTLIEDDAGNLYGTTWSGGVSLDRSCNGCGTIFKIDPEGAETVLYTFPGGAGGQQPEGGVVRDAQGNLYGTAYGGGDLHCQKHVGCGIAYKLTPDGTFTVIHVFEKTDGAYPVGGLIGDGAGNLYGTTTAGGAYGGGTIFELTP